MSPRCIALSLLVLLAPVAALTGCPFGSDHAPPAAPPYCDGNVLVSPALRDRTECPGVCHDFGGGEVGCYAAPLTACEPVGMPVCLGEILSGCTSPGYVAAGGYDCAADGRTCTDAGVGGCAFPDVDCPAAPDGGSPLSFCTADRRALYAACMGGHPTERATCPPGTSCHDWVEERPGTDGGLLAGAECALPIPCDGPQGAVVCSDDRTALLGCGGHGFVVEWAACGDGAVCHTWNGVAECVDDDLTSCGEGEARCTWDEDAVQTCGETGYLLPPADCDDLDWDAVCVEKRLDDGTISAGCHVPPTCQPEDATACDEEKDWLLVCEDGDLVRAEECGWGCEDATDTTPAQCD